jgi:hypothetical protein
MAELRREVPTKLGRTVPVSVATLKTFGFGNCIKDGRRCLEAVDIIPENEDEGSGLYCHFRQRTISAKEAKCCRNQK